jgi:hypothetical protein
MSNYTKLTDFASKDTLPSGNAAKIVKGTEIDDEFEAIESAIATKANTDSPALSGTPTAPTPSSSTSTTQIATTAFVQAAITNSVDLNTWTVEEASGVLYFKVNGVNKAKLDSSGNLTVTGNVTAYGTV